MMKRLFSEAQTVPPKYARALGAVHDLADRLPDGARTAILREVEHLRTP